MSNQAAACFRRCLSIDARNAAAHNNIGLVHAAENRLEAAEASACFQRCVAIEPGLAAVHARLGRLLLDKRRPLEAGESFERALTLQPGDADAHVGLARALGSHANNSHSTFARMSRSKL